MKIVAVVAWLSIGQERVVPNFERTVHQPG